MIIKPADRRGCCVATNIPAQLQLQLIRLAVVSAGTADPPSE